MTLRSRWNTADNFTCEDVINEQKLLYSDNVCIKDSFFVSQSDIANMSLKVRQGTAKIKGVSIVSDAQETVSIVTNTTSYARYDLVVLEINSTTYVSSLKVLQGTPASYPNIPDFSVNQLALAKIYVAAGATSILDSNITDVRNVFPYSSIEEATSTIIKKNKSKTSIAIANTGIDLSPYDAKNNWYSVRNGFCTLMIDIGINWTGNNGETKSVTAVSDLPAPVGEIHFGLPCFDNNLKIPQDVLITESGALKIFNIQSHAGKIRYSGTITYQIEE